MLVLADVPPLLFLSPPPKKFFAKNFGLMCYISPISGVHPLSSMDDFIPEVDENVPLPASALEAMPPLSAMEEVEMRGRTLKMLSDLTGKPIEPTQFHRGQAVEVVKHVVENKTDLNLTQYPNETMAYLAGMVAQYDHMIVRELADLKLYVVNKLLAETDNPDGKIRLPAIKALGEIDGVDAFKRRTEVTHKTQPIEEVERELLETLQKAKSRAIDVVAREVPNANNA